ncbi:hypothetical protein [Parabacteroides johnsonii]|uniref:hypothetical protein n=1 Tax=Parabacteroides johnsonii TaxID=387661 RepID=UPI003AB7E80A
MAIPYKGCMSVSDRLNTFRWEGTGILPGLPSVGDGLATPGTGGHTRFPLSEK